MVLLANLEERNKALADLLNLGSILLVGIVQVLESTCCIHVIAGVDAYLLGKTGSHISHPRIEVYVSHQRHHAPFSTQGGIDMLQVFRFAHTLRCEAYIFTSCFYDTQCLFHAGFGIHCDRIGHALQADRVLTTQRGGPHIDGMSLPTRVVEEIHLWLVISV